MFVPLLEDYLDSLYEQPTYIVPGFIYKRTDGIIFINKFTVPGIAEEFTDSTPAAISIDHIYNYSTREIDGSVKVIFDSPPDTGDFRIGLMIVEDFVKGGEQYDQRSYFDSSDVYPELNGLGNPIKGYEHMDVFRDTIFGGISGKAGVIPQSPEVGKSYLVEFHYEVPAQYLDLDVNVKNLKLIAFTGYYNGEVLNADEKYVVESTNIKTHSDASPDVKELTVLRASTKGISFTVNIPGSYEVNLYTSRGQKVGLLKTPYQLSQGRHSLSWSDKKLSKGIYILHFTGTLYTTKIPIIIYK
jgi:hypothetical protein